MTVERIRTEMKKLVETQMFYPALTALFALLTGWVFWVRTESDLAVVYAALAVAGAVSVIMLTMIRAGFVSSRHTDVMREVASDEDWLCRVNTEVGQATVASVAMIPVAIAAYVLRDSHEPVSHAILLAVTANFVYRVGKVAFRMFVCFDVAEYLLYQRRLRKQRGSHMPDAEGGAHAHD